MQNDPLRSRESEASKSKFKNSYYKKLLLIDGNALIHRAYHAFPKDLKAPKKDEKTGAIFGFTKILLNVVGQIKPDYIICSFDLEGPTFRHLQYKEYKAKRVKPPQEMYDQIPRIKEVVKALGIPIYEKKGYEADDIIGSIVAKRKTTAENSKLIKSIILTGDMDTLQLINEHTTVLTPGNSRKAGAEYDADAVNERYGFGPKYVVDFKALAGDASDNIPGIKGIGELSAKKLIQIFGSINEIYKQDKETLKRKTGLSDRQVDLILNNKDSAEFSKKLATIKTDLEIEFNLNECRLKNYSKEKAENLFHQLGFKSLLGDLPGTIKHEQASLFS